jgi:hypothetical protein
VLRVESGNQLKRSTALAILEHSSTHTVRGHSGNHPDFKSSFNSHRPFNAAQQTETSSQQNSHPTRSNLRESILSFARYERGVTPPIPGSSYSSALLIGRGRCCLGDHADSRPYPTSCSPDARATGLRSTVCAVNWDGMRRLG